MLTQAQIQKIVSEINTHEENLAALLPALHILMENDNQIDSNDVEHLAQILEISPQKIWGVISFYDCFNYRKESKYILKICTGICCSITNSEELLENLKKKLNIEVGETTPGRMFSLQAVDCLGHCDEAPVLQVNNRSCHTEMTPEKIDELLKELRREAENDF